MSMPRGIAAIDTLIGFPSPDPKSMYEFFRGNLRDQESLENFQFPAQYMFKDVPEGADPKIDPVAATLYEMDRFGVERGMVSLHEEVAFRALKEHPDRFIPSLTGLDANRGMEAVRDLVRLREEFGLKAVGLFPAGCVPQVPIDDKRWYPIYAKCSELGIVVFVTVGVPGPRMPMACQKVELLDEICWFFPDLKIVMRHGGEPWQDLAVKLMLKWPNLYYSTSAFAPKHYPKAIVDYANTRGGDKVMYAGYWPWGLTLERIFADMPKVPFKEEVWPKFLRGNAARVLDL